MKVKVTKQDISDGIDNVENLCGCPIWRALNRQLGLTYGSEIEFKTMALVKIGRRGKLLIKLPEEAVEWQERAIEDHDSARPITFDAKIVEADAL